MKYAAATLSIAFTGIATGDVSWALALFFALLFIELTAEEIKSGTVRLDINLTKPKGLDVQVNGVTALADPKSEAATLSPLDCAP